jgi:hypothetical protein
LLKRILATSDREVGAGASVPLLSDPTTRVSLKRVFDNTASDDEKAVFVKAVDELIEANYYDKLEKRAFDAFSSLEDDGEIDGAAEPFGANFQREFATQSEKAAQRDTEQPTGLGASFDQAAFERERAEIDKRPDVIEARNRLAAAQQAASTPSSNPLTMLANAVVRTVDAAASVVTPPATSSSTSSSSSSSSTKWSSATRRSARVAEAKAMQDAYYAGRPEARAQDASRKAKQTQSVERYRNNVAKLDFRGTRNNL